MAPDHNNAALVDFAERLKAARLEKGLSQRALSQRIGVPQSHISRIESGQVDLKTSSLVEIARALGFELTLVPRSLVPAVEALSRSSQAEPVGVKPTAPYRFYGGGDANTPAAIERAQDALAKAAKDAEKFSRALGPAPELTRLSEAIRDVERWPLDVSHAEQVHATLKNLRIDNDYLKEAKRAQGSVNKLLKNEDFTRMLKQVGEAADRLRSIRNALAHGAAVPRLASRPAYRLSDNGDDGDDNA